MRIEEIEDIRRLELLIKGVVRLRHLHNRPRRQHRQLKLGAERLKGHLANKNIGRPFRIFFTSEDQDQVLPQRALSIAATEGRFESEGWRIREDGTRFWALASSMQFAMTTARLSGSPKSHVT